MSLTRAAIAVVTVASLLAGCSIQTEPCSDVNQDKIYQGFTASYSATDDQTSAEAQFRFGGITGTTLSMDGKCSVTHDSVSLSKSALSGVLGTSYSGSKSGYVPAHTFTFTNSNAKSFVNSITNANTIALSSPPSTLSRSSPVTLSFTPAVGANESVSVYVSYQTTPDGAQTSSVSGTTSTQGATSASISAADLSRLTAGAVTLHAERTLTGTLQQPSAAESGHFYFYYYGAKTSATLTD